MEEFDNTAIFSCHITTLEAELDLAEYVDKQSKYK